MANQGRFNLRSSSIALLLVAGVSACEEFDEEGIDDLEDEEDEDRLSTIGANVLVTSAGSLWGNETSAVGFPSGPSVKVFVSYNSNPLTPRPDGTTTHCGWAVSVNGAGFLATDDGITPLPGYGVGSDGSAYKYCLGDTWSTDASWSTTSPMVAMVAAAKNINAAPIQCGQTESRDVAMWTSTNGGSSFGSVALLSNQLNSGGCVDGPKVEWDLTNHKAWVWWFNSNKIYLRPVAVSAAGAITPGATVDLTGKLKHNAPTHATMAIKPAAAAGQNPTIWLAYADAAHGQWPDCNIPSQSQDISVTWWLSKSTDGGVTWTHLKVDADPAWPRCISATPSGANRSMISSVYDPSSGRVMLAYSRHIDDANGDFVGTRVVQKQWPKANGAAGFDTWIPICNGAVCPNPPPTGKTCLVGGAPPVGETFCHQFGPAVGVKGSGTRRYAVVWHDTRDSQSDPDFLHPTVGNHTVKPLLSDIFGASLRSGTPLDVTAYTVSRITPMGPTIPWEDKGKNGNLWWGDYEDGVVPFGSKFYSIWGDNRDGTDTTKLYGAEFDE